jgi:hypothetical protein
MRTIKHIISFFVLLFFFNGCTKDDVEGPLITDLYGTFSITDSFLLVNKTPDFSSGDIVKFYCGFNKTIDWKITITGLQSNSVKEISGFSSSIDSNNVMWSGTTSQLPFFNIENCAVELTFMNESDTLRDTLNIVGTNSYEDGILVADFENGLPPDALVSWTSNIGFRTFDISNDDPLLGNAYFKMGGKVNWDWPIGKLDLKLSLSSVTVPAEEFYINIGILSDSIDIHTGQFINIMISESTLPFNDDLTPNQVGQQLADIFDASDEVYKMKVPVDWHGWRILSFPYSEFEELSPGAAGIIFNKNPNNISGIRIACQACPSSGANVNCPENLDKIVRTDIDHIIFTEYSPLLGN